jgi:ABC-type uncharacterized transport system auxiliary subunit
MTETITETRTATPIYSPTITATFSATRSATGTRTMTNTKTPTGFAAAFAADHDGEEREIKVEMADPDALPVLEAVRVVPNPSRGSQARRLALRVVDGADRVKVRIYSAAMVKVYEKEQSVRALKHKEWIWVELNGNISGAGIYHVETEVFKAKESSRYGTKMLITP